MRVSRTVSIELNDLNQIEDQIKKGKVRNISEFVQKSVKKRLKEEKD